MNPNLKWEKRILNISFIGSLLFLIAEIIMATITGSHAVFMDCVYDVADLIMIGPFILLIPLLYKDETEKRPYGFSQVESLFIMIKSSLLVGVTLLLIFESIKLLIVGGNDVDASTIAIFELIVSFTCVFMYLFLSKLSKNYTSPSIQAELYIWKLDALSTLGVGVTFLVTLLLGNTSYNFICPYVDPLIAIVLAIFLLKEPVGLFIESIKNLILFAPDSETSNEIKKVCEKILEENDCYVNFLDIIKTGRKIWVEVYFVTKDDLISIDKIRDIREKIVKQLNKEFDSLYLELIPDLDEVKPINEIKMKRNTRRPDKITHMKKVENKKENKKNNKNR